MAATRPSHHREEGEGVTTVDVPIDPENDVDDHNPPLAAEDADEREGQATRTVELVCGTCGATMTEAVT